MNFDTVIKNGRVYDGSGNAWYKADVGVKNSTIAAIGNLAEAPSERSIDATGLAVSPGFIDMHNHCDLVLAGPPQ
ncbi:MAG: D-aminoacylase, partial [Chloroflexi bacterium]|nr:D-aminoacylase [Chloroflexota bacterium]